jgi:preprotein translocase subunit SecE
MKEDIMADTPYEASEDLVEKAKSDRASRRSLFGRISLFFKQVVGELKKVTRPTNRELINYTGVVLGFVTVVITVVFLLDLGFFNLVSWAFTPSR